MDETSFSLRFTLSLLCEYDSDVTVPGISSWIESACEKNTIYQPGLLEVHTKAFMNSIKSILRFFISY